MMKVKAALRQQLEDAFGITHATLELELPATARDHDTSLIPGQV